MNENLPSGWEWKQIGTLGQVTGGGTPSKSNSKYWNGDIPWISPKDMKSLYISDGQDHITPLGVKNSAAKLVPANSILLVFRSGILAHSLPIAIATRELTVNQDIKVILPSTRFIPEYILFALKSREQFLLNTCVKKGATVHSIDSEKFWTETMPVPYPDDPSRSLDVQRRIVARIEALFTEVREMRALQASIRANTQILFNTILQDWFADLDRTSTAITIGELLRQNKLVISSGGTPSKQKAEFWTGDIPWVSPKDMKSWLIEGSEDHITEEALISSGIKRIPSHSVLVVVRGMILARNWPVGITCRDVTINQDMKALIPGNGLLAKFLGYVLVAQSPRVLREVETAAHGTKRLTTPLLESLSVPQIPISHQQRAIEYLEAVQAEIKEMLSLQQKDRNELQNLENAILSRAFRGEL